MDHRCIAPSLAFFVLVCFPTNSYSKIQLQSDRPPASNCAKGSIDDNCNAENEKTLIITQRKSPLAGLTPTTQSNTTINLSQEIALPTTLTELIEGTPGVAENSQPGLYQVVSIRGISRQRILTLAEGIRLSSDRRAGVAASFIDPMLLESVDVTRGPISSYYGSGAIGGVTDLHFARTDGVVAGLGYKQSGNQQFQFFRAGNQSTSASVVHRKSNNSEDINSNPLNTHFEQTAGYVQKSWQTKELLIDQWLFSSVGNDLGRSNSRFPDRVINIPDEKHTLFKTAISSQSPWSLDFSFHDQSVTTQTFRPEDSLISVKTSSLDWAANWQTAWEYTNESIVLGLDYNRREKVNSREIRLDLSDNALEYSSTLRNGEENELALFYAHHKQIGEYRLQFGGRYTYQNSGQSATESIDDWAVTGFAGIAHDLSEQWEFNANIGNSFRFPSLTEKFFSGTTARGFIQGNPDLQPEKAITFDFGVTWHSKHQSLIATIFATRFNDYIERIEIVEESLTFVNQDDGKIDGLEVEIHHNISELLNLKLVATAIDGKNSVNSPISDIPSDRVKLVVDYTSNLLSGSIGIQHRFKKADPGNGELPTDSATIMQFSMSYQLDNQWLFSVFASNLLNEQYVSSADDLATLAEGINYGFNIVWQSHP